MSSAPSSDPVAVCLTEFGKFRQWRAADAAATFEVLKRKNGAVTRPVCSDPLNGMGNALLRYERENYNFHHACTSIPPVREGEFFRELKRMPEFQHRLRFYLACQALADANSFQQWRTLDKFRDWERRGSHAVPFLPGRSAEGRHAEVEKAVLRRFRTFVIPHYPDKAQCDCCNRKDVRVFPVNFPADEVARKGLNSAAKELVWLTGLGKYALTVAALGSAFGKEAYHVADEVASAAEDAHKRIEGHCIGIIVEGKWLSPKSDSRTTILVVEGESLGLPVLVGMIGDLIFKGRPGIPDVWKRAISRSYSSGKLRQHRVEAVGAIEAKKRAAGDRTFWFPLQNDELCDGGKPRRSPGTVDSVADVLREITGFRHRALGGNTVAAAVLLGIMSVPFLGAEPFIDWLRGPPSLISMATAVELDLLDKIQEIEIHSTPAFLVIRVRDVADDGDTNIEARALGSRSGRPVRFFRETDENETNFARVPVHGGVAYLGIDFAAGDVAEVEVSAVRRGSRDTRRLQIRVKP